MDDKLQRDTRAMKHMKGSESVTVIIVLEITLMCFNGKYF